MDRKALEGISLDFRKVASRLLRSDFHEADKNLQRFLDFIDSTDVIADFIRQCLDASDTEAFVMNPGRGHGRYPVPTDPSAETAYVYLLLKGFREQDVAYYRAALGYGTGKFQDNIDAFNRAVVMPFMGHIETQLHRLLLATPDVSDDEARYQIGTFIGSASQSIFATDGGTISDASLQIYGAEDVAQAIESWSDYLDDVPEHQRRDVALAIRMLAHAARRGEVRPVELAEKAETIATSSASMRERLKEFAASVGAGVTANGVVYAVRLVLGNLG